MKAYANIILKHHLVDITVRFKRFQLDLDIADKY